MCSCSVLFSVSFAERDLLSWCRIGRLVEIRGRVNPLGLPRCIPAWGIEVVGRRGEEGVGRAREG